VALDALHAAAIAASGVFMGWINNLAGGGGALGIVAFEELAGMDAKSADINLRPSALAIGTAGFLGFRSRGTAVPARAWWLGTVAVPGSLLGSYLAIELPVWILRSTLAVILLLVLWQQLSPRRLVPRKTEASFATTLAWFTLMGAHLGFVQVGAGLLTLIALVHLGARDLIWINSVKSAVVILTSAVSVGYFTLHGQIDWPPALCLASGCAVGSFLASRWSVDKGSAGVRWMVIAITVAVLLRLAWQTFAS
jgi:uncharacterized membrane protein YfcA